MNSVKYRTNRYKKLLNEYGMLNRIHMEYLHRLRETMTHFTEASKLYF